MSKKYSASDDSKTDDQIKPVDFDIPASDVSGPDSQVEELTADLKRLQAEFINYKSRVEVEKVALSRIYKAQVIKDLLPVIDDLERALSHQPEDLKGNKWADGVTKVYDRLQKQLEKLGVTRIDALNQPFNPELHEAIHAEGEGDDVTVSEVLQSGYQLEDQVIRHALVKVVHA